MNELLSITLDAHGGINHWRDYEKVEATIVSGGGFFPLKGMIHDATPRRITVWLHQERWSLCPFGKPDQGTMVTPERIAIEKLDGTVGSERDAPRDSFAGHQMSTPWDALHRAHFNGYALWTYLTTPFLLAMDGVRVEEVEPWREGAETWHVLRAQVPGSIETHSLIQEFFFGTDLQLRRHDYSLNIAGGFPAAQLTSRTEFICWPSAALTRAGLTAGRLWKCGWFPLILVRSGSCVHSSPGLKSVFGFRSV